MTPQQDIDSLWAIYEATKAQLIAVAAEKVLVLASLTTLRTGGTPDFSSISQSGMAGSESYTLVALQARFDSLTKAEIDLGKLMADQRLHAVKAEPGMLSARVANHQNLNF